MSYVDFRRTGPVDTTGTVAADTAVDDTMAADTEAVVADGKAEVGTADSADTVGFHC